ncbi:hypothetical protein HPP92_019204 [Vanilla planifolia]|uniref:PAR1 protein n=1 Tax=Vanilla planifolia TaxID=51239 RepID=A0A835QDJ2_VANPL|nr:hypothetical protein HPP92_019204 [Vanilla planifolia]
MASQIPIALILSLALTLPFAHGREVVCEELPAELCAFAVSSAGKRCVVESYRPAGGETAYQCRVSDVSVERMVDLVETDECVAACGADRGSVGISSDALLDPHFTEKLCSPQCYENCPNLIDLYYNLAAGEGIVLSHLCEARRVNPIRAMAELHSAAAAPSATELSTISSLNSDSVAGAPTSDVAAVVPAPAISDDVTAAASPSDVSQYSADPSFDELDADPVPVPATSPTAFFDDDEGEDAEFI